MRLALSEDAAPVLDAMEICLNGLSSDLDTPGVTEEQLGKGVEEPFMQAAVHIEIFSLGRGYTFRFYISIDVKCGQVSVRTCVDFQAIYGVQD